MAAGERRYDERDLGPRLIRAAWWYSIPSTTRRNLVQASGVDPVVGDVYIGQMQDALMTAGNPSAARRFMAEMQKAVDAEKAADAWMYPSAPAPAADDQEGLF